MVSLQDTNTVVINHVIKITLTMSGDKQLFTIDGYRIWAHTYEEALRQVEVIKKF